MMLSQPCETLSGIGPTLAKKLAKCGIFTIQDLLFHLPFRYQDRTRITPIQDLRPHDWCVVVGRISKTEIKYGKRMMLYCCIEDKTGFIKLRFFHFNKQQMKSLQNNNYIHAFGEVRQFANQLEMIHPEYQLLNHAQEFKVEETLTPIYPTTQGLTQNRLRQLIKQALATHETELAQLEWMTATQLAHHAFQALHTSITQLHNPPPDIALSDLEQGCHPCIKRLVFDELLAQRLSLQFAKQKRAQLLAPAMTSSDQTIEHFLANLAFPLTKAQSRVFSEIRDDLLNTKPMLRLVQGDVGAGKTVIAALAAIQVISSGYQVAFMVPTEILSEQHAQTLASWLEPLGIKLKQLTGKMKPRERKETLLALANHQCQLLIGTHALFQQEVIFSKLGLIIIDEQHRFGVEQRLLLQNKGKSDASCPHQLVLTATPIPRTLAMTQFAHLDLSLLDELPPGRTPVTTAVLNQDKRELIIARLQQALASGQQVYWVCTLIEDSEKLQCMAATQTAKQLQQQLPQAHVGLIHGRMKAIEKERIMHDFKKGAINLLVATTVIEVGVDIPNASLMIIENAERLGLSQLHQLRGRVGRGAKQSYCLLLYQAPLSWQSAERLRVMRATNDGFVIAEKDLELRGSGEFLGTRQTGEQHYKVANLQRDKAIQQLIGPAANQLLQEQPSTAQKIVNLWRRNTEPFLQG